MSIHPDPFIKVFDMRTMRQLSPLTFGAGRGGAHSAPALLSFFPNYTSTIMAAAPGGSMCLMDAKGDGSDTHYLQVWLCISMEMDLRGWKFPEIEIPISLNFVSSDWKFPEIPRNSQFRNFEQNFRHTHNTDR